MCLRKLGKHGQHFILSVVSEFSDFSDVFEFSDLSEVSDFSDPIEFSFYNIVNFYRVSEAVDNQAKKRNLPWTIFKCCLLFGLYQSQTTLVWTLIGFKYFFLLGRSVQEKFRCSEDLHNIRPCSCNERFVTNDVVLVFVGDVGGYMYDVSVLVDQVSSFFSILLPHFEVFDGTAHPFS